MASPKKFINLRTHHKDSLMEWGYNNHGEEPVKMIQVGNRWIGPSHPCFITAEIGINHNGDMGIARRTIDAAAEAGADAVKLQNYEVTDFLASEDLSYSYKSKGKDIIESQVDMFKRYELSVEQLEELKAHCDLKNIVFFSTPTGLSGIQTLKKLGSPLLKNGSDFLTHLEIIRAMAETGIPTVLSTGMATVEEIDDAVNTFRDAGGRDLILLHCTSSYPTPSQDINLRRIPVLQQAFECLVGFSDHSEGSAAAIASVVLGSCFIEKHFTLDRNLPGPDHWFSSDPDQLKQLIAGLRQAELALGGSRLAPAPSEQFGREQFRLSCVAARDLPKGTKIFAEDLLIRRPGTGIPPKLKPSLVGLVLKLSVKSGQAFKWEDFHE